MEHLIGRDIPQRTAHALVGTLANLALERDVRLSDLTIDDFKEAHADLDETIYDVLGAERAVASMVSYGSTGPQQVDKQISRWKTKIESHHPEP